MARCFSLRWCLGASLGDSQKLEVASSANVSPPARRLKDEADYFRIADDTHSIRPNHVKGSFLLKICKIDRDCGLLAYWDLAPQFLREAFEEDHLVVRLLRFRCLDWHYCGDAFIVGRESEVKNTA
jgi:hypothetical protein